MHLYRRGPPEVFLVPLPQDPSCFSNILLSTVYGWTLVAVDNTTLLVLRVLIFGLDQYLLEGPVTLEMCPYAIFEACVFDTSRRPCTCVMTMCPILGLPPGVAVVWLLLLSPLLSCIVLLTWVLPISSQLPFITLFCTLFMAHLGFLHLTSASLRSCNSSSKSPVVVQTDLALLVSLPMTLYLAVRLWWLSHCKYWSVWVGTLMLRELSASGLTKVSRKGIAPFSQLPSRVNFMLGSILLIWSKKSCYCFCTFYCTCH